MNILVATASRHGSTREIGALIAELLGEEGFTVGQRAMEADGNLLGYDAAVLGSAVYMGNWMPAARSFVEHNRVALSRMPIWLFSSGPVGPDTPALDAERLERLLRLSNVRDHRVFPGKLDRDVLGFGERLTVRLVRAPEGDYRDWEEIRAWAHQIAVALGPEVAAMR